MVPQQPASTIHFPTLPLPSPNGGEILVRERAKATFDVDDLARYIHGEEYLKKQEELLNILQKEPLFDKADVYYQGRDKKFRASMAKAKRMIQVSTQRLSRVRLSSP
jgi:acyl-CoA oxidase